MSIQGEIDRINNEVSTQTNLIKQIQTALQNKAAGGSGSGIEMCTVTIEVLAPALENFMVYASNSSLQVIATELSAAGGTFQAAKGTIAVVTPWESMARDSNQIVGNYGGGAWIITEDCTIAYDG